MNLAGRLNQRVELYNAAEARNEYGEVERTWSKFADRWAEVKPLMGRTLFLAQQTTSEVTHRVTMRPDGLDALTPKSRIKWAGVTLEVESTIDVNSRGEELQVMCRQVIGSDAL